MANRHKGEVSFQAGDETYVLRFSVDALCALEEAAGKGIIAISQELGDADRLSIGLIRKVLWAGLREHHPKIDMKAAGELITDAGGIPEMVKVIGEAFELAFPESNGDGARPQQPGRNGTGPVSTVRGAA